MPVRMFSARTENIRRKPAAATTDHIITSRRHRGDLPRRHRGLATTPNCTRSVCVDGCWKPASSISGSALLGNSSRTAIFTGSAYFDMPVVSGPAARKRGDGERRGRDVRRNIVPAAMLYRRITRSIRPASTLSRTMWRNYLVSPLTTPRRELSSSSDPRWTPLNRLSITRDEHLTQWPRRRQFSLGGVRRGPPKRLVSGGRRARASIR
jgi:hypothetical protein